MRTIYLWQGSGDPAVDSAVGTQGPMGTVPKFLDIWGQTGSPPMVSLGVVQVDPAMNGQRELFITQAQLVDAVHAFAPALGENERDAIARNVGAVTSGEAQEMLDENVRLAQELEQARGSISELAEQIAAEIAPRLAEVIDLDAERAKRSAAVAAKPVA